MIPEEIKRQIFKTPVQWQSGLSVRLKLLESGGITLYDTPDFSHWPFKRKGRPQPCCLTADPCGPLYFIARHTGRLYRYHPVSRYLERIPCIGGKGTETGKFNNPTAMAMDTANLWVLDSGNNRVQVFSRETFQFRHVIQPLKNPIDMTLDENSHLYVLQKTGRRFQILTYNPAGGKIAVIPVDSCLKDVFGLAASPSGDLLAIERKPAALHKMSHTGEHSPLIENFAPLSEQFEATHLIVDKSGSIYIVNAETGKLHQFDPQANHISALAIPGFSGAVEDTAADAAGNIYAATDEGLAFFSSQLTPTDLTGVYYSRVLDSGIHKCQWHRLAPQAQIPRNSRVQIYYSSFDNEKLKEEIDNLYSAPNLSTAEKIAAVETISVEKQVTWIGPETNPPAMLFREKTGRYLRLKIVLSTLEKTAKPEIAGMTVFYPALTYMEYLPALYREDKSGGELLEHYLSLFQTISDRLEEKIDHVPDFFDPAVTPAEFLPYLSTWTGSLYDETWGEESWRLFLSRAYELYKKKGTRLGLQDVLEIYTGHRPYIIENFQLQTRCEKTGPENGVPADEDALYAPPRAAVVRYKENAGGGPETETSLRALLYGDNLCCFCVVFKPGALTGKSPTTVERIIEEWKPAHTCFGLVELQPWIFLDSHTYTGVNTYLTDPGFVLNDQSAIGRNTEIRSREKAGQVGIKARIDIDLNVT